MPEPISLDLRKFTSFVEQPDGTWSAQVVELGLAASGSTKDEAFDVMRSSVRDRMGDAASKTKLGAFIRQHGDPTTPQEYDRKMMDHLRSFDEPVQDQD